MYFKNKLLVLCFGIISLGAFFSCKKDNSIPEDSRVNNPTERQQILDSLFLYADQIYFWNNQLPSISQFNTKKYTGSGIGVYQDEIFDITRYAINPATNQSFEYNGFNPSWAKYSTIIETGKSPSNNKQGTAALADIGYNYGVTFLALDKDQIYVEYVIKNSPADVAGLKRGMRLMEVNGTKSETSSTFYDYIKSAFDGNSIEIKVNGGAAEQQLLTYQLKRASYTADPVNKVAVLNVNAHKIGYISYLKFASPGGADRSLVNAFNYFNEQGVSELIIDLRYNGGGDVTTCDNFANMIVPAYANGRVMRKEKYNRLMQQGKAVILANQPILNDDGSPALYINGRVATLADGDYTLDGNTEVFQKTSGLANLTRVYFIVSNKTASASELLINCLKPYMSVKLIGIRSTEKVGEAVKTFGKPIGFFNIKLKTYQLYLSLFQNLNAADNGDYFDGMPSDRVTIDDARIDFGENGEPGINSALTDMGYLPAATKFAKRSEMKMADSTPGQNKPNGSFLPVEINSVYQHKEIIKLKIKLKNRN